MIQGLKHLTYKERLIKLWLFSMVKTKVWEDKILQYLREVYKKDSKMLFTRAFSAQSRGNGFKLKETIFRSLRKKFCTTRGCSKML